MTVMTRFATDDVNSLICLDSDCLIMLINDLFIDKHTLGIEIQIMMTLVSVDEITGNKHMINKYIVFT